MRKLFTILAAVILSASLFAQAPQKMSYQAVIRNNSNSLVVNTNVGMQISILQYNVSGTPVYIERQFPNTNANGLVTIEIGAGTVVSGNFSTINWTNGPYFVKTETDLNGGANYTIIGTNQLLSVPYALNASSAENANNTILFGGQYPNYYIGRVIQATSPGCGASCPSLQVGNTNAVTINSISISVPGPGNIYVSFNGFIEVMGTGYLYVLGQIVEYSNAYPSPVYSDGGSLVRGQIPSGYITYPMNSTTTFYVSSAGTYTFYFRAANYADTSPTCNFYSGNMSAIYTQDQ
jgi:hypothetical protein